MSIILSDITLDPNLHIPGLSSLPRAAGFERVTLGGRRIARRMAGLGRTFSLTAELDGNRFFGRFFHWQVELLAAIRDAGEPVPFVYHSLLDLIVIIPMDGLQLAPWQRRSDPPANLPYSGIVKLQEA